MTMGPSRASQASKKIVNGDATLPDGRRRDREVLDAAARVFYAHGYASSTVQDVADELGILKGSLYHYINAKEDLLFRIVELVHAEVERILSETRDIEGLAPLERLREYVKQQVLFNLDNLVFVSVYYHEMDQLSAARVESLRSWQRTHAHVITDLIAEAQARGEVPAGSDPRILANCVFGTVIWTYRWYRPSERRGREAIAEHCASYALHGVAGAPMSKAS
jgi:AcrR family transcriptional regulator